MNRRPERVSSLIREELAKIIRREAEFGPGVLVTLTEVDVDKKLGRAKVGVSVFPSDKAQETLTILNKAAGKLQWLLFKKINIKPMPRIVFGFDRGPEHAAEIEKKLLDNPEKN